MAKLNKNLAKQARDSAEDWTGTGTVPPGLYLSKLTNVDTTRSGPAGPYWTWEYEVVEAGDQPKGKKFWDNTSLSEKAIGRLGKVFEAFGAKTDADTDDLIGSLVSVEVKLGTITKGERAGEQRNEVVMVFPADTHPDYDDVAASSPSGPAPSDDDF